MTHGRDCGVSFKGLCYSHPGVNTLMVQEENAAKKKKASDLYLFMCIETEKDEMMSSKTVVI